MNSIAKIAMGLGGWIAFEQRSGREALFSESYLANPIGQLLQYRFPGQVSSEVLHPILAPLRTGPGKKPRVDFAVRGNNGKYLVCIETKWVSGSQTLLRDILRDLIRLDLLIPEYAELAVLIVAGKKKNFEKLMTSPYFKPHPNHLSSNPLLPIGTHTGGTVRFDPMSKFRSGLLIQALEDFGHLEVSKTIRLNRSGPYPHCTNTNDYEVYAWTLRKPSEPKEVFNPADLLASQNKRSKPHLITPVSFQE